MQPLAAETRFPGPDATGRAAGLCQPMSARFCARQLPGSARSTNFAPVATVPAARRTHLRPAAAAAKTASAPALGRRTSLSPSPVRARAAVEERAGLGGGVRRSAGPPHASAGAAGTAGALRPGSTPRCGLGVSLRCCVHCSSCGPALAAPRERTGAGQGAEGGAAGGAGPGGAGVCRGGAPGTTWGKVGRHPTVAGTAISFLTEGRLELGACRLTCGCWSTI